MAPPASVKTSPVIAPLVLIFILFQRTINTAAIGVWP
jgi:hypothetical protein